MDASTLQSAVPILLLLAVGYLLLIRPTRTRARGAAALQSALSAGDEVMLTSGLYGRVIEIVGEAAFVEIAANTVVRVHRGAVSQIIVDRRADDSSVHEDDDDPAVTRSRPLGDNPEVS